MVRVEPTWLSQANERGQIVLLAALAIALALVPMILAVHQLGYAGDVETSVETGTEEETVRLLERAVHDATTGLARQYEWGDRDLAIEQVHEALEPTRDQLATGQLEHGVTTDLTYNESRAAAWAATHCRQGPNRQFGECTAIDGVVVQERQGRTHVLAVAFDVTTTTPDGASKLQTVIDVQTR